MLVTCPANTIQENRNNRQIHTSLKLVDRSTFHTTLLCVRLLNFIHTSRYFPCFSPEDS